MPTRRTVVLGLLGQNLDAGGGKHRWKHWRPTVSLALHDDLQIDRLELLHQPGDARLAATVRADVCDASPHTEVRLWPFSVPDPWDFEAMYAALHDFAEAYPFDPQHEDYLVHITTGTHVAQICLFLLTESRHMPAQLLQTSPPRGARDSHRGQYTRIDLDLSRYDQLAARRHAQRSTQLSQLKAGIATENAHFNALIEQLEHVAVRSRAPLLLTGPTGAGKSQLAQRVFELKQKRQGLRGAFAQINCATVRGDAAHSALFGHVKGAFTGALTARAGLLAKADHGVLFLDEIGELGLDQQAMLLRALEEKVYVPLGGDAERRSDFQLISGTNRDLWDCVRQGSFRGDLLERLNLWHFALPALAERLDDLAPNLEHELERAAASLGERVTLSKEARAAFLSEAHDYPWPGNFRELSGVVLRLATLADGARIRSAAVRAEFARMRARLAPCAGEHDGSPPGWLRAMPLDRFDRVQLADVVAVCRDAPSLSAAGRELFAHSRAHKQSSNDADRLRKYLQRFGLEFAALKAKPLD